MLALLNGLLFLLHAWSLWQVVEMFQAVDAGLSVPPTVPLYAVVGGLLVLAGAFYLWDMMGIRRWFYLISPAFLIFGYIEFSGTWTHVMAWSGVWSGELVATTAVSGAALILLAPVSLLTRFV